MFCFRILYKFRILVYSVYHFYKIPCIPLLRSVSPSVRQSAIPPNKVTLTVGVTNFIKVVDANPQQENNFVFLSPFHSIFVIYTPNMLSERVSASLCSEKETMCFISAQFSTYQAPSSMNWRCERQRYCISKLFTSPSSGPLCPESSSPSS